MTYEESKLDNILGIKAAIWTEFISNQKRLEYMKYLRLMAIAEKAWTIDSCLDWDLFQKKMVMEFERYNNLGINYRIPAMGIQRRKEIQPEAFEGPIPSVKSKFLK